MLSITARSKGARNWVRQAVIAFVFFFNERSLSEYDDDNMPALM